MGCYGYAQPIYQRRPMNLRFVGVYQFIGEPPPPEKASMSQPTLMFAPVPVNAAVIVTVEAPLSRLDATEIFGPVGLSTPSVVPLIAPNALKFCA
jgi:hypothetical protein